MALPEPLWSNDDIDVAEEVDRDPSSLAWKTWNNDPIKIAVLRAIVSRQGRVGHANFGSDMAKALAQQYWVCFLHFYSSEVEEVHY